MRSGPRVGVKAIATDLVPIVCASGDPDGATHAVCAATGAALSSARNGTRYFIKAFLPSSVDGNGATHADAGDTGSRVVRVHGAEELEFTGGREHHGRLE